jgi:hypothetical protein
MLMPGDTVNSSVQITPTVGDASIANNTIVRCDTVRSSFDPNAIEVLPQGHILNDTRLQYTIHFENTGNDTAKNIHVIDTLSSHLKSSTIELVFASSEMNISVQKTASDNVVIFDFPNINLPDSSHHGLCHGIVVFTIKPYSGLACDTQIHNRASIYFDLNEGVLTNTVNNSIYCAPTFEENLNNSDIQVPRLFPNPASSQLIVEADNLLYDYIAICNNFGQILLQQKSEPKQTKLDIQMLPPGIYCVRLVGNSNCVVKQFFKE